MNSNFLTGKVSKKNKELGYSFMSVAKVGDIFFNLVTNFENTSFRDIVISQKVSIHILETFRGLFANSFSVQESSKELSILLFE